MNALSANFDPSPAAGRPLWTAAVLSLAAHAALLAALGSIVSSAWRSAEFATAPGSGTPLQAWLVPRAAEIDAEPPPEPPAEPPMEVAAAPPPPAAPQPMPSAAPPTPIPMSTAPGLTQPGAGEATVPRRPPPLPADIGDVAVGPSTDLSPFGAATRLRLAALYPVKPGRLPRVSGTVTVIYPEWALRDRASAHVDALLLLDAKGAVLETMVEPDDPIFATAVRDALAKAAFLPAQAADTPLPYWIALEFVFAIDPVKPASSKAN